MSPDDNASPQGNANDNEPKDQLNAPQVGADTETPATQGGIFSTPDLTVDAQNIRLGQAALSENDKERVARAFGQTDATRRAIAEAEQVVNANATMPSTATGDIELGAKSKGKNRSKLLIIIAAAVAVVAIVVGVGVVLLGKGGEKEETKQETYSLEVTKQKFNEYANYLLFGSEDSGELTGSFESDKVYQLDIQLDGARDDVYWTKSSDLLNDAILYYDGVPDRKKPVVSILDDYRIRFVFLNTLSTLIEPSEQKISEQYFKEGMDGVVSCLDEFYASIPNSDNAVVVDYVTARKEQLNNYAKILDVYAGAGCERENNLNTDCIAVLPDAIAAEVSNLSTLHLTSRRRADTLLKDSVQIVESGCWTISELFSSEEEVSHEE